MLPPRARLLNGELWDLVFALLGLGLTLVQFFSSILLGMFVFDILH